MGWLGEGGQVGDVMAGARKSKARRRSDYRMRAWARVCQDVAATVFCPKLKAAKKSLRLFSTVFHLIRIYIHCSFAET